MTDPARQQRIEALFQKAADLPESERTTFLDAECGDDTALRSRLGRMFCHHDDGMAGFLDSPAAPLLERGEHDVAHELTGQLGRYRIIRLLGEGGMGAVYEAEQDHPRRIVALKVIHRRLATRELLRRFEREAEILGRLQHPGIAHIYDAGRLADMGDRPYLAMEIVRGLPLSAYAREQSLSTSQRLDLVARICDAVQHAHDQGVIHRDLKPANILIDAAGQPKILDFGVARFIEHEAQMSTLQTHAGQLIGTVPYMSPEQVAGNVIAIDRQSDVYSIGVILFELLSDRLPYALQEKSLPESARIIQEVEPTSLSSVDTRYRGDIETIVAKALEKDRSRRYATAGDLAADLRRHLAEEPIRARPQTTMYRFRKFARRHRVLVGATLVVFVVLIAGIIGVSIFAVGESQQRARAERLLASEMAARQAAEASRAAAEREAEKARATVEFIQKTLSYADPERAPGKPITVVEALDRAGDELATLKEQPEVAAAVEYVMGNAYASLGEVDKAKQHLSHALELRRSLDDAFGIEDALCALAMVHIGVAEFDDAARLAGEAVDVYSKKASPDPLELANVRQVLALALDGQGKHEASIALLRQVLSARKKALPANSPRIAETVNNIAFSMANLGQFDEAEKLYRETIEDYRKQAGSDNRFTIAALHNLASLLMQIRKLDEAREAGEEALDIAVRVFGAGHPTVAEVSSILADVAIRQGRFEDAMTLSKTTLDSRRERLGDNHDLVATSLAQYGYILRRLNRLEEAERVIRESLAIRRHLLGDGDRSTLYSLYRLVDVLVAEKKFDEARPLADQCFRQQLAIYGPDNPAVTKAKELLETIPARDSAEP